MWYVLALSLQPRFIFLFNIFLLWFKQSEFYWMVYTKIIIKFFLKGSLCRSGQWGLNILFKYSILIGFRRDWTLETIKVTFIVDECVCHVFQLNFKLKSGMILNANVIWMIVNNHEIKQQKRKKDLNTNIFFFEISCLYFNLFIRKNPLQECNRFL